MISAKDLVEQPGFHPGAYRDKFDGRDFKFGEGELAFAAKEFDWEKGYDIEVELAKKIGLPTWEMAPKDQGASGSCGGQSWSYYSSVLEAMFTGTVESYSAKYVYAQNFAPGGGTFPRDNAQLYVNQGICLEAFLTSYENGQPPSEEFMRRAIDISDSVRANARNNRASAFASVNPKIDLFASALAANYGMTLGISGENNGTWLSPFPQPAVGSDKWGHALYVGKAKLINGKKHVGILNSWGKDVGERGWQWISEDHFLTGNVWPGWTHVFNVKPVPPGYIHEFKRELDYGMENAEVMALQKALQSIGFFHSGIIPTKYFGRITEQAVQEYQCARQIVCGGTPRSTGYGRVGQKTIAQLNKEFTY